MAPVNAVATGTRSRWRLGGQATAIGFLELLGPMRLIRISSGDTSGSFSKASQTQHKQSKYLMLNVKFNPQQVLTSCKLQNGLTHAQMCEAQGWEHWIYGIGVHPVGRRDKLL